MVEISIKDLGMVYSRNETVALEGVTLDIERGEFVSLLGPSGCGKTTLLRIIANLLEPTSGALTVADGTPEQARKDRKYGIVFQSPVLQNWRTVRKNVELPLEIMHVPPMERRERADAMLHMVGLHRFFDAYPEELSGGMQQRVGIARALVIEPEILLMDEPFSALDEFTREKLQADLLQIWQESGKTIVFVTHNIAEAVYLSDRVCVFSPRPGRLSAVVDVKLKRPRPLEIRDTAEFVEYVARVRGSFEGV
ncbi:MAG: ABC transporter ATP-binding protein [Clostridiales Family XIII bacterium]|jgi:NitT/TauT family transport system ATP-binding protein|nr:ABC transporter ATP-binding protein [Clostridiales Family XIII bacterium]